MRRSFTGIAITILSIIPWLAAIGNEPHKITDLSGVWVAEFNEDGSTIIVQNRNGTLGLWDTEKGSPIASDIGNHEIKGKYVVSDDHSLVLISPEGGLPRVFDLSTGRAISPELKVKHKAEESISFDAYFSPDNSRLLFPDGSGNTLIFELPSGELLKTLELTPSDSEGEIVGGVAFSKDGQTAFIMDGQANLRKYETGAWEVVGNAMKHPNDAASGYSFVISPDGRYAASFDWPGENGTPGVLQLWDTTNAKAIGESISGMNGMSATFLEDGKSLLIQPGRGETRIVKVPSLETHFQLRRHDDVEASRGTIVANGTKVLSSGYDSTIILSEVSTGKHISSYSSRAHLQRVHTGPDPKVAWLVFDNTAFLLQNQYDQYVIKFSLEKLSSYSRPLKPMATLRVSGFLHRTILSPNGKYLMIHEGRSGKERIRLFNANDMTELASTTSSR